MAMYREGGGFKMGGTSFGGNSSTFTGTTQRMPDPEWSEWKKAFYFGKKTTIGGQEIRGFMKYREVKVLFRDEWDTLYEYATDKEIFEGNLKGSISDKYTY